MSRRPPPAHRATTAHLRALYPFVGGGELPAAGPYLGREALGGAFCHDPWERYLAGELTNPNLLVAGQIGRGKSTFVKTFVWRQLAFGREAWIIDPKGEYGALAAAAGCRPLRLAPGGSLRLNPLDAGVADRAADPVRGHVELCCAVAEAGLGRPLAPAERTAVDLAVRGAQRPDLPAVVDRLLDPDPAAAAAIRTDAAGLAADGRQVALELRRLVSGDLAGMFDAPTTDGAGLSGPVVVIDLSAVYDSAALGVLMTCAVAWLHARLRGAGGPKRLVVVDEAWAVLHDVGTARWLQSSFKLSRAYGVANLAVVHRLSDLRSAGSEGSEQRRLAEGLLADSETRVLFAQAPSEIADARSALGLTAPEAAILPSLPRGVALWRLGSRSLVVEHVVAPGEAAFTDTDRAMRCGPGGAG